MKGFECKLYCNLLKINYKEFNELTLKQQIELIENLNNERISGSSVLKDAKQKLLTILYQDRDEEKEFDEYCKVAMDLVNNNPKKPQNGGEGR